MLENIKLPDASIIPYTCIVLSLQTNFYLQVSFEPHGIGDGTITPFVLVLKEQMA